MRPSSFFSSSSSSPSSSATATTTATTTSPSVDGRAYNSKNGSPGCLTGVLRRLLCLDSLRTYPRDRFKEEEKQPLVSGKLQCVEEANYPDDFNTPGVVARLMGLESRPHVMEKSPKSIGRSQSMNAIHSLTKLKSIHGKNRHVKSFREIPSYKELEDESFFVISFENAGEIWQGMKSDINSGQKKQTKKAICKDSSREKQNKENQDTNKVSKGQKQGNLIDSENSYGKVREPIKVLKNSCQKSYLVFELVDSNHKERGRTRRKKAKSKVNKLETGCESKDSSPNSVLDFAEFPPEPDPDAPDSAGAVAVAGEVSRLANSKFQRTLSEELENHRKAEKRKLIRYDYDPKRSKKRWDEVCQLVERETLQSNWIFKEIVKEADDFQDIGRYLGLQILDQLLAELVNNLMEIPMKIFDLSP